MSTKSSIHTHQTTDEQKFRGNINSNRIKREIEMLRISTEWGPFNGKEKRDIECKI